MLEAQACRLEGPRGDPKWSGAKGRLRPQGEAGPPNGYVPASLNNDTSRLGATRVSFPVRLVPGPGMIETEERRVLGPVWSVCRSEARGALG